MTEKELLEEVRELAELNGWMFYHTFDSRRSTGGFPDCILVRPPDMLALELKVGNRIATEAQLEWLIAFNKVQQVKAAVIRPKNLEKLAHLLKVGL